MFCKYCGANVNGDEKFCPNCGKVINNSNFSNVNNTFQNNNQEGSGSKIKPNINKTSGGNGAKSFLQRIPKPLIIIVPIVLVVIIAFVSFLIIKGNNTEPTLTADEFIEKFNEEYNSRNGTNVTKGDWEKKSIGGRTRYSLESGIYAILLFTVPDSEKVYGVTVLTDSTSAIRFDVYNSYASGYSATSSMIERSMEIKVVCTEVFLNTSYEKADTIVRNANRNNGIYNVKGDIYINPNTSIDNMSGWSLYHKEYTEKKEDDSSEVKDSTNSSTTNTTGKTNTSNSSNTTTNSSSSSNTSTSNSKSTTTVNTNPILYDEAKILSDEESKEILNTLSSASGDADIAMVFLTTDTDDGTKDSQLGQLDIFVESYYNNNLKDKTQAKDRAWILGYDNNSKQFVMRSFGDFEGEVHLPFTTYERKQMSENIEQALNNKSYVSAVKAFVNEQ